MRPWIVALAGLSLLAVAGPAKPAGADTRTGKALLALCEAPESRAADRASCIGFMRGAIAMYELVGAENKELAWFCPARNGDPLALRQLYVEWAHENPSDVGDTAIAAVRAALADAFSCTE